MEKKQGIGFFEKLLNHLGCLVHCYRNCCGAMAPGNPANIKQA